MSSQVSDQMPQVAILCQDRSAALNLSNIFRTMDVLPLVFEELEEFWFAVLGDHPHLSLVDIRSLSQGKMMLKDHPLVVSGELPLVFYIPQGHEPLIQGVGELPQVGMIFENNFLPGQLKPLLNRLNHSFFQTERQVQTEQRLQQKEKSLEELSERYAELGMKFDLFQELSTQHAVFKELVKRVGFLNALTQWLEGWSPIKRYALQYYDQREKKLKSYLQGGVKSFRIPSLYLERSLKDDQLSLIQADQQAMHFLGDNLSKVMIKGLDGRPEWLLYLESTADYQEFFPWGWLGDILSLGFFEENRQTRQNLSEGEIPFWEFIDLMQKNFEGYQISHSSLYHLDLSSLLKTVRTHHSNRFHWKEFFEQFYGLIHKNVSSEAFRSDGGLCHSFFLVSQGESDQFLRKMKKHLSQFDYWNYFSNADKALTYNIDPFIHQIPMNTTLVFDLFSAPQLKSSSLGSTGSIVVP